MEEQKPASKKPDFRIIKKAADGKKWDIIGAAWIRDNNQGFSVSFEPNGRGGEKIKCLMVLNDKKEKTEAPPKQLDQLDDEISF